jgi:hypothetical protein
MRTVGKFKANNLRTWHATLRTMTLLNRLLMPER